MWLQECIPKTRVEKIATSSVQNMITTLNQFNEHGNPHFDNEWDIHMNSKHYEESGYNLNLDLLTILYESRASNSKRSGIVKRTITI